MKNLLLPSLPYLCTIALVICSCALDKEPEIPTGVNNIDKPVFLSADVTPDTNNNFQATARLSALGNLNILHHGWVWSEAPGPTLLNYKLELDSLTIDSFTTEITGLDTDKLYYLRPFVATGCDTIYGPEQCSFLGVHFTINTDMEIFQGADVQFSTSPIDNCTYLWDFGDGSTSTDTSLKHRFSKAGTITVRLTVDFGGCSVTQVMTLKIVPDPFEGYWVPISSGTFTMGCTSEQEPCNSDEFPSHQVTVDSFFIGRTEITQRQWLAVMGGDNPSFFESCGLDCPVEFVSWNDIKEKFLPALYLKTGRVHRLPTEAEWEFAARGGANASNMTKYAGSNELDSVAWHYFNSNNKPHQVTQIQNSNGYGLYDMSGNVWEYVEDDYHDNYEGAPSNGSSWTDSPQGDYRVIRGGSWKSKGPESCRTANRESADPTSEANTRGFRLARSY